MQKATTEENRDQTSHKIRRCLRQLRAFYLARCWNSKGLRVLFISCVFLSEEKAKKRVGSRSVAPNPVVRAWAKTGEGTCCEVPHSGIRPRKLQLSGHKAGIKGGKGGGQAGNVSDAHILCGLASPIDRSRKTPSSYQQS